MLVKDAVELTGLSERWIRNLISRGDIPAKIVTRMIQVPKECLELDDTAVKSLAERKRQIRKEN